MFFNKYVIFKDVTLRLCIKIFQAVAAVPGNQHGCDVEAATGEYQVTLVFSAPLCSVNAVLLELEPKITQRCYVFTRVLPLPEKNGTKV